MQIRFVINLALTVLLLSAQVGIVWADESARSMQQSGKAIPYFWVPVSGVGEGIDEAVGSMKHINYDAYAIDYVYHSEGVDIYPALPGRVVYSGCVDDYGCTVVIRHWDDSKWDRKYYSIYAHLQEGGRPAYWELVNGTRPIGRMGKTGRGSNDIIHLHFAVRTSNRVLEGTDALYGRYQEAFNVRPRFRIERNRPQKSLDLTAYCGYAYGPGAYSVMGDRWDAYSWSCYRNGQQLGGMDLMEACRVQHPGEPTVVMGDRWDAYSWYCTWP